MGLEMGRIMELIVGMDLEQVLEATTRTIGIHDVDSVSWQRGSMSEWLDGSVWIYDCALYISGFWIGDLDDT
jgi:hypothetical protein